MNIVPELVEKGIKVVDLVGITDSMILVFMRNGMD